MPMIKLFFLLTRSQINRKNKQFSSLLGNRASGSTWLMAGKCLFQLCIFIQMTSSHPKGDRVIECRHQRNQVLFRALHLYYTISKRHGQNGTFSWFPTRPEKRTTSNSILKIPWIFFNLPCKFHNLNILLFSSII